MSEITDTAEMERGDCSLKSSLERVERGAHNLLKVASAGTCEAAVARVSLTQCERQRGSKGLKSEVSN